LDNKSSWINTAMRTAQSTAPNRRLEKFFFKVGVNDRASLAAKDGTIIHAANT
jgi:hypothetical protein